MSGYTCTPNDVRLIEAFAAWYGARDTDERAAMFEFDEPDEPYTRWVNSTDHTIEDYEQMIELDGMGFISVDQERAYIHPYVYGESS